MVRPPDNREPGEETDDSTPLEHEDLDGLIPAHVQTKRELNQWEALNIARGQEWASQRKSADPLSVEFLRELHRRMFGETWTWAGAFRRSDTNISPYAWTQVPPLLHELVENVRVQYEASNKTPESLDEIAARYHYQLVRIHPWPNGNGRHARLATDLLLKEWDRPPFTWGSGADLVAQGEARTHYIAALRAADAGDYGPLLRFVRS